MPKLLIEGSNNFYQIQGKTLTIGRSSQCEITISDNRSSRRHCEVGQDEEGYYVKDLNSFNGTFVNGKRITLHRLNPNDKIKIGSMSFLFESEDLENQGSSSQGKDKLSVEAFLAIMENGSWQLQIPLQKGKNRVGRKKDNEVYLDDEQISSRHAEIHFVKGTYVLRDLQSRNGTWVDDQKLATDTVILNSGATVKFGKTTCLFWESKSGPLPDAPGETAFSQKKEVRIPWPRVVSTTALFSLVLLSLFIGKYFWGTSFGEIKTIPGNLIYDFSFEENFGWQFEGALGAQEVTNAPTGHYVLEFSSPKAEVDWHEARYWDVLPVSFGKAYRTRFSIRYKNLQGIAGLKLVWLCEGKSNYSIENYTPFLSGSSLGWEKQDVRFLPPPEAKKLRISCFVQGNATELAFDDIVVEEIESAGVARLPSLRYDKWEIFMNQRGVLDLYYRDEALFRGGKIQIREGDIVLADQARRIGKREIKDNLLGWSGEIATGGGILEILLSCSLTENGFQISYSFSPNVQFESEDLCLSWEFSSAHLPEMIFLVGNQESVKINSYDLKEKETQQIFWQGDNSFGFTYAPSVVCSIFPEGGHFSFRQYLPLDEAKEFIVHLKGNYQEDERGMDELQKEALQLEEKGEWGKAYLVYQKLLNNFLFFTEEKSPQTNLQRLEKDFYRELGELEEAWEQARFFQVLHFYENCQKQAQSALEHWADMPSFEKLEQVSLSINQELEELKEKEQAQARENLWKRALQLEGNKEWALAIILYKELQIRFSENTLTDKAQIKIEELKKKLEGE